ncbi:riboflavin synthase [Candidatus Sumerlaeota bacterium]|nr:riboflavin synthase [Candidatus Sumerlaeota bacterium]
MFTGIIEEVGTLIEKKGTGSSFRLKIGAKSLVNLSPGDSVAIDGACLTVELSGSGEFVVYSSPETISRTTLVYKKPGSPVNLERALLPSTRLNGHFVLGHVDGVGNISDIRKESDSWRFFFRIPETALPYCVEKGSIAIDGISLTIAGIAGEKQIIEVAIIPFTFERTTLKRLKSGDAVNVEADILAKYAKKFLEPYGKNKGITIDLLEDAGFM